VDGEGDNGTIKVEFMNFGKFTDAAVVQANSDKPFKPDLN